MTCLQHDIPREETACDSLVLLVYAAQSGDREAFGQLVERFEQAVYATAMRRLRNHAEAQELTQEVFYRALQKIGQLRQPERFAGWLRAIAVRMAINRASRSTPMIGLEPESFAAHFTDSQTPVVRAMARERDAQVRAGLKRLGQLDRDTLLAFYMRGRTIVEMSDEFQSPIGTIKRRLHVARKRLALELAGVIV